MNCVIIRWRYEATSWISRVSRMPKSQIVRLQCSERSNAVYFRQRNPDGAQDDSITIVSISFFNFAGLLDSVPDFGNECDFASVSLVLTFRIMNNWPWSMTFSGASLGGNIVSGSWPSDSPDASPVWAACRYTIGCDAEGGGS